MTLSLSSVPDVLTRIASAHDVAFGSYFLTRGPVRDALAGAARHGAHVAVTLQADPYRGSGARAPESAASARVLRGAGAHVSLLARDQVPFHLKAAVCDGVAYLDDRNWTQRGPEIVVADDDPRDVALLRDALAGHGGGDATLATRKDEALRRELALIESAPHAPVIVETERIGTSPISAALRRHARGGAPTTLVLGRARDRSPREVATIARLAARRRRRARGRLEPKARARRRHGLDRLGERDGRVRPRRRSARVGDGHARSGARRRGEIGARARRRVTASAVAVRERS